MNSKELLKFDKDKVFGLFVDKNMLFVIDVFKDELLLVDM